MWGWQENYRLQEVTEACQEMARAQLVKPNFTQMKYKVLMSELASGWILWSDRAKLAVSLCFQSNVKLTDRYETSTDPLIELSPREIINILH